MYYTSLPQKEDVLVRELGLPVGYCSRGVYNRYLLPSLARISTIVLLRVPLLWRYLPYSAFRPDLCSEITGPDLRFLQQLAYCKLLTTGNPTKKHLKGLNLGVASLAHTQRLQSFLVMSRQTELPVLHGGTHDSLRLGLPCLKADATFTHPVEAIQENTRGHRDQAQRTMLANLYGSAVPAKDAIERQILSRTGRLPGLDSSRLGLDSLSGTLDEFSFQHFLGQPSNSEVSPPDVHSQMETKLGLSSVTNRAFM